LLLSGKNDTTAKLSQRNRAEKIRKRVKKIRFLL